MPTSSDFPACPNHQRGTCERSQVVLLNEVANQGSECWVFGCETCLLTFVRTKPVSQARGQYGKALRDRAESERRLRRWESRTKFFVPHSPFARHRSLLS